MSVGRRGSVAVVRSGPGDAPSPRAGGASRRWSCHERLSLPWRSSKEGIGRFPFSGSRRGARPQRRQRHGAQLRPERHDVIAGVQHTPPAKRSPASEERRSSPRKSLPGSRCSAVRPCASLPARAASASPPGVARRTFPQDREWPAPRGNRRATAGGVDCRADATAVETLRVRLAPSVPAVRCAGKLRLIRHDDAADPPRKVV